MLVLTYTGFFPRFGRGDIETIATMKSFTDLQLDMEKVKKMLRMAQQPYSQTDGMGEYNFCDELGHCEDSKTFPAYDLVDMLSLPPSHLKDALYKIVGGPYHTAEDCESACSQDTWCGIQEMRLSGKLAGTFGASMVNLCSPDTNLIQLSVGRGYVWKTNIEAGCEWQGEKTNRVVSVTFALGIYLAVDVVRDIGQEDDFIGWPNQVRIRFRIPVEEELPEASDFKSLDEQGIQDYMYLLASEIIAEDAPVGAKKLDGTVNNFMTNTFGHVFKNVGSFMRDPEQVHSPFTRVFSNAIIKTLSATQLAGTVTDVSL